jgi:hypothetical protein
MQGHSLWKELRLKIAALIQAHHRPDQLSLLLERLNGELWSPFVHIDRDSDIGLFHKRNGAVFIDRRVRVNWGGLSQVEATRLMLREAFSDHAITHFYHMSGQCYPVKTDEQIRLRIEELGPGSANLMELTAMPVDHKPLHRYTDRFLHDVRNPLLKAALQRVFWRLPPKSLEALRGIRLFGGGSWWLLERDAVAKVLEFLDANPWYWRAFRYSASPDEMLLHSLMAPLNISISGDAPTAATWVDGRPNPETVTRAMHDEFVRGPALFARKYAGFHPAFP